MLGGGGSKGGLTSPAVEKGGLGRLFHAPHHLPSPTVGPRDMTTPQILQPQRGDQRLSSRRLHSLWSPAPPPRHSARALGQGGVGRRWSHGRAGQSPGYRPHGNETQWRKAGCPGSQGLSWEPRNSPEGRSLTQRTARTGWEGRGPGGLRRSPEPGEAGPLRV